jgi:hypothetical protein
MRSRLNLRIHRTVIMGPLESQRRTKTSRSTTIIIVIGVIVAAVIAGIGVATALMTYPNTAPTKQCSTTPTKMFDKESVPKYIIGPNYKVIPVNPVTTEVILTGCK